MKLAILGGGGVRMPAFVRAVLADTPARFSRIALFEPDPLRRETIAALALAMAERDGHEGVVSVTGDLDEAVEGCDAVFSAMRVGGDAGRVIDEQVALERGLVGQETVGPGGCAMALRTIPAVLAACRAIESAAPNAILVNFTNPAGVITQAIASHSSLACVGVCDTPSSLVERLRTFLAVRDEPVRYGYLGLNHLGWVSSLIVDGKERIDELLARYDELRFFDPHFAAFDTAQVQAVGALPSEYVFYYYDPARYVETLRRAPATRGQDVRAFNDEIIACVARELANGAVDAAWSAYARVMGLREASYLATDFDIARSPRTDPQPFEAHVGGYEQVALSVIDGLSSSRPAEVIVNVENGSAISFLETDDVVEVPATVSAGTVVPNAAGTLSRSPRALISAVKEYERQLVEAAVEHDGEKAALALALHPLVPGLTSARELLAAYREAHGPTLAYLD